MFSIHEMENGKPLLYKSEYDKTLIEAFPEQINTATKEVFVYFNNTWGTAALHNARQLQLAIK